MLCHSSVTARLPSSQCYCLSAKAAVDACIAHSGTGFDGAALEHEYLS